MVKVFVVTTESHDIENRDHREARPGVNVFTSKQKMVDAIFEFLSKKDDDVFTQIVENYEDYWVDDIKSDDDKEIVRKVIENCIDIASENKIAVELEYEEHAYCPERIRIERLSKNPEKLRKPDCDWKN